MGNASKFTFKGMITLSIEYDRGYLVTSIEDTGIGMSEGDLRNLFQFFGMIDQSKGINRGGMGLGLTISKMIVQQLNGTINVESKPKVGSKFTFKIPSINEDGDFLDMNYNQLPTEEAGGPLQTEDATADFDPAETVIAN